MAFLFFSFLRVSKPSRNPNKPSPSRFLSFALPHHQSPCQDAQSSHSQSIALAPLIRRQPTTLSSFFPQRQKRNVALFLAVFCRFQATFFLFSSTFFTFLLDAGGGREESKKRIASQNAFPCSSLIVIGSLLLRRVDTK